MRAGVGVTAEFSVVVMWVTPPASVAMVRLAPRVPLSASTINGTCANDTLGTHASRHANRSACLFLIFASAWIVSEWAAFHPRI